jgi:DNA primase
METSKVVAFLQALNVKKINPKSNNWVEGSCPLARWRHNKAIDVNPSFGVIANEGEVSVYFCFACGKGSLKSLVDFLEINDKENVHTYNFSLCRQLIDDENSLVLPLPPYQEFDQKIQVFEEWPEYWVDSFVSADLMQASWDYLKSRNVTKEKIDKFRLRFDSGRNMIVAPYRNVFGKLSGARGRSIYDNVESFEKHYDYSCNGKNNCKLVWYNEEALNLPGPVVVVEGQFDCWNTLEAYPKTISNLTAMPTEEKVAKLSYCRTLIQIPDNDKAGKESVQKYSSVCKQYGIDHRVLWLHESVKDPAECSPIYLKDRIEEFL